MKNRFLLLVCLFNLYTFGQTSDDLIPKEAVIVLGINNTSLLKKISMDSLIQYEFMEEVQAEMFDGSGTVIQQGEFEGAPDLIKFWSE